MCIGKVPALVCISYMLLLIALLTCSFSFVAPFWLLFPEHPDGRLAIEIGRVLRGDEWTEGLWAACIKHEARCTWFWQDNFALQNKFPDWHKAAQGLYTAGLIILLTTFAVTSMHVCCKQWRDSLYIYAVLASLTLSSLACIIASMAVYGGYNAVVQAAKVNAFNQYPQFSWGYFISVAGLIEAFFANVLLFVVACRHRKQYTGYRQAVVV